MKERKQLILVEEITSEQKTRKATERREKAADLFHIEMNKSTIESVELTYEFHRFNCERDPWTSDGQEMNMQHFSKKIYMFISIWNTLQLSLCNFHAWDKIVYVLLQYCNLTSNGMKWCIGLSHIYSQPRTSLISCKYSNFRYWW